MNQTLRTNGIAASRDYQDLPAWTKSISLAERIYMLTEEFPTREHAGLAAQMRASALTVASCIASASAKNNEHGITESYSASQAGIAELTTQLTLAARLGHVAEESATSLHEALEEISRLLIGLKHGLKVAAKDAERAERDAAKAEREQRAERAEREDRPRREYKPRDGGEDRPRREYKPRDGGEDRPRREYKPRDGGEDRPRREYKPRDAGDRKPYGDKKPFGDKKPYGDRKPYGDKKPYGSKKPFGDRKPSGGKPFRKPRD